MDTDDQIVVMDGNTVTPNSNPNNLAEGVINIMRRGSASNRSHHHLHNGVSEEKMGEVVSKHVKVIKIKKKEGRREGGGKREVRPRMFVQAVVCVRVCMRRGWYCVRGCGLLLVVEHAY